ncbi:MAG: host-nuclease inhibitor Gam family protein [Deltaproteobacteria bacterium]|nr:host-nuclease inhibitor Gam family protein [Deltaproteobacteria bacterium]
MKLGRHKVQGPKLGGWDEVDAQLRVVGQCDMDLEALENELTEDVNRLRLAAARKAARLQEKRDQAIRDVTEYIEARREDLGQTKSRVLNFGVVGFRVSTRLKIRSVAETLQKLRAAGMLACIRVKEEPDKERLREYSDEILATVGVARKVEDAAFCEPNREAIRGAA